MKTLYVVRHAKSSWDDPLLDDFSRPLNDRGKKDAPRMGKRLKKKKVLPDLILVSPARRTLATAKKIAEVLDYAEEKIKTDSALYHASSKVLLSKIKRASDAADIIMIVGHNPGLTEFVNELMDQEFDNIPTCGIAACTLDVDSWKEVKMGMGKMIFYDYPKSSNSD